MGASLLTEISMNNILSLGCGKSKILSLVAKMNCPSTLAFVSLMSQTHGVKDTEMYDSNIVHITHQLGNEHATYATAESVTYNHLKIHRICNKSQNM